MGVRTRTTSVLRVEQLQGPAVLSLSQSACAPKSRDLRGSPPDAYRSAAEVGRLGSGGRFGQPLRVLRIEAGRTERNRETPIVRQAFTGREDYSVHLFGAQALYRVAVDR